MNARCSADGLKAIVAEWVDKVPKTGSPAERGTRLAALVTRDVRAKGLGAWGLRFMHVGRSFRTFPQFPVHLADEEIETFVRRTPALANYIRHLEPMFWRTPQRGKPYRRKLGRLIPDFVAELPDGRLVIWDLTSRSYDEHMAKTRLYGEIASQARGGADVELWEFHWNPPELPAATVPPRTVTDSRADRF